MFKEIEISKILVEDRQRKDLGNIHEMAFSIEQNGLLQPIVVEEVEGGNYRLISGERRLRAYQLLRREMIPASLLSNLDPVARQELELEENLRRKNMTWIEEIRAESKLHKLKIELFGRALPGKFGREGGWGIRDTSQSLSLSMGKISQDLQLADALDKFPDLVKCKTLAEAMNLYRKLKNTRQVERQESHNEIRLRECFVFSDFKTGMDKVGHGTVSVVITDVEGYIANSTISAIADKIHLVGHIFLFFPLEKIKDLTFLLEQNKLHFTQRPFIWYSKKEEAFRTFLWASRGLVSPPKEIPSLISANRDEKKCLHARSLPYSVIAVLLQNTALEGSFILDPICYGVELVNVCLDRKLNCLALCPIRELYEQYLLRKEIGS